MNLEKNEQIQIPKNDSQINLIVTNNDEGDTIDFVRVFHNMKLKRRFFAWVLLFCMLLGIAASLLMYQIKQPMLTVSSVVTFDYDVLDEDGEVIAHVSDLTAPNGKPIDLDQITSSYVLQKALDMTSLSSPISVASLRRNIRIEQNLTEESKQRMEVAEQMVTDKNNAAYTTVSELEPKYENKVVVSLTNGFTNGDDDTKKTVLQDGELAPLLNNILYIYNEYLVLAYANQKLPDDQFSVIDVEGMDFLESLDLIRSSVQNLFDYCDNQPGSFKEYRSPATGLSLIDLMEILTNIRSVNVDYLYSYVYTNSIAKNSATMLTSYEFQLRNAQSKLSTVQEGITTTQSILDVYKNDEIYVSMQDSDTSRSTQTTTDYYNELVLQQVENYDDLAEIQTQITDLENKIANLKGKQNTEVLDTIGDELNIALHSCKDIYQMIYSHMEEIFSTVENQTYAQYSAAFGKTQNFLAASAKNMLIFAIIGAVIACGLWFLSGFIEEMKRGVKFDDADNKGMEVND